MKSFSDYIVNVSNLRCNISMFKRILKDNVKLCAVVKADAYGVGVKSVCENLVEFVDYFAVSNVIEAKQIRELNIDTKILILGSVPINEIEYCVKNNIEINIYSVDYLKSIIDYITDGELGVHLKINTGLNRYGFKNKKDLCAALKLIDSNKNLKLVGVFTHFATKGNDLEFLKIQKNIFQDYLSFIPKNVIRHCANSFASLYSSTYQQDMIRVGVNMYGDVRGEGLPLKDVVSITSQIVSINKVAKGQSIGYDRTYIVEKNSLIAVVPLGYADGVSRRASNKMYVLINGQKAKIVGNICMDAFMVDVTDIKNVFVGSRVVILGEDGGEKITCVDWAKAVGTSPYEILLNFRYKRMNYVTKK